MCGSTQGSLCPSLMGIHHCMWIQWSILQITTYIHTYYIQNEWSHSLFLNSVQARQKLDSLSPIHRFIGQAMSWGKYWERRYVEPNIFPTHGKTNKFVYWMKNRIQFYHYYVLKILCPISLYTFCNKQISNKGGEKKKKNLSNYDIQNYFNLDYQIMEKNLWRNWHYFYANGTKKKKEKPHWEPHRERGYHLKNIFSFFFVFSFLFFLSFFFFFFL